MLGATRNDPTQSSEIANPINCAADLGCSRQPPNRYTPPGSEVLGAARLPEPIFELVKRLHKSVAALDQQSNLASRDAAGFDMKGMEYLLSPKTCACILALTPTKLWQRLEELTLSQGFPLHTLAN